MEQFNLDKWLQDKSHKVVTRDGRPVRIVCWDLLGEYKIIGVTDESDEGYTIINKKVDGTGGVSTNDLFFADEEEELTEFEKALVNLVSNWCDSHIETPEEYINKHSQALLNLARKEIHNEQQEKLGTLEMPIDVTEPYYIKGKQDALKDLPKWKKAKENLEFSDNVVKIDEYGNILCFDIVWVGEYYIDIQSLKSLPKEE